MRMAELYLALSSAVSYPNYFKLFKNSSPSKYDSLKSRAVGISVALRPANWQNIL